MLLSNMFFPAFVFRYYLSHLVDIDSDFGHWVQWRYDQFIGQLCWEDFTTGHVEFENVLK